MNLYDIPGMNGRKTLLGSWGTILTGVAGVLTTVAAGLTAVAALLAGDLALIEFANQVQPLLLSLGAIFGGLLGLGLGHKIEKATPSA